MTIETGVKTWLKEYGRPLEKAQMEYTFSSGSQEEVIEALQHYQNKDGGFAHGLEPDFWTLESNPIDTWTAIQVLRSLDLVSSHPLIQSTLRYLEVTPYQEENRYFFRVPDNNNHPHAPWWHYTETTKIEGYNPSAALYAFILKHEPNETPFYHRIHAAFITMVNMFLRQPTEEMHELRCMSEALVELEGQFNLRAFREKIAEQVIKVIEPDSNRWFTDYCARPSQLIESPQSPGYEALQQLVIQEIDLLKKRTNAEGVWDLNWSWAEQDPVAFAKAEKDWQSIMAYNMLIRIKRFTEL